jgi:CPA2 family monovalent cation:H+ antiporter-2
VHDLSLISTIAAGFTAAWLLGLFTQWLRLSPIVGYILAGVIIGPHTPGFVGDVHIAQQLAEVGVILLMFGVGLHFHVKDLYAVKNVAIPGAVGQSLAATVLAMVVFHLFGMPYVTGAVLGMAMAVASTVVLMRVLVDADMLNSRQGHVAVGWLIVEDIFTVILLVVIPVLGAKMGDPNLLPAGQTLPAAVGGFWATLGIAMLKLVVMSVIVLVAGAKVVPWMLVKVARLRSRELFTLTVLVFSVAVAAAAYFVFGASMALGAFLAGMVVAQSPVSHQAAADALPLRDAFAVLFFVSVGMLFDPSFLIEKPLMVLAALGIILIAKPLAALFIVAVLGHSVRTALTVALGLAQIGEFSFILSELARQNGLMPVEGHNVLVAAAIISITINPMLFRSLPKIEDWLRRKPKLWNLLNGRAERHAANRGKLEEGPGHSQEDQEKGLAIVVGYGPVGRSVHRVLMDAGIPTVVIDMNMDTVTSLHAQGHVAIYGDASNQGVLEQAGMKRASHLVVTLPNASFRSAVVTASRALSATVRIVVRARYLREREELEQSGATAAVFEEAEAAVALSRLVLADTGTHRQAAEQKLQDIRLQLIMDNFSNIRSQRIATVMVPWARVRSLQAGCSEQTVLSQVAQERFSRWPVVDSTTRRPVGYLLTKDLIAKDSGGDWQSLIRPIDSVHPNDSMDATLTRMQTESASIYIVEDNGVLLGLITLEDILEQVVGRLEDEDKRNQPVLIEEAMKLGGVIPFMEATNPHAAIRELVAALPLKRLPVGMTLEEITRLALAREDEISTNLGNGIAVPHARCPGLSSPLVVFGRSKDGVNYPDTEAPPVGLFFLLVTPAERPETQLSLLRQLAKLADTSAARDELLSADSPADLMDLIHRLVKHPAKKE